MHVARLSRIFTLVLPVVAAPSLLVAVQTQPLDANVVRVTSDGSVALALESWNNTVLNLTDVQCATGGRQEQSQKQALSALVFAVTFSVVACGDHDRVAVADPRAPSAVARVASAASAATPSIDPCTLVSAKDMSVMFGELKEGPAPSSGLRNERQCNYTNMAGSWLKLSLYSGQERWEWEKGITNAQNPKPVGGLGDEAFAIQRGTDGVMYVRKGETILELSCSCAATTAEAIARVTTARL